MNSSRQVDLAIIFCLFVTIDNVVGTPTDKPSHSNVSNKCQNLYQPLYVVVKNEQYENRYELADSITYDLTMNQNQGNGNISEHKMLAACSITDTKEPLLEITSANEKLVDGFCCKTPIKFFVQQKKTNADYYSIGFMIRDKKRSTDSPNKQVPKNDFPVTLILVRYRKKLGHSITTWHDIKYATKISTDDETDCNPDGQYMYQKDTNIYGFDIDYNYELKNQSKHVKNVLGSKSNSKLVKLQLAPAGDFFFDALKQASRTNINTVPVWQELISEWHQLEKFIRRVSKIVGDLQIITGGTNGYNYSTQSENVPVLYLHGKGIYDILPIFRFIFKAVSYNQQRENGSFIRQGILFVMVNDPRANINNRNNFADKNGWKYLHSPDSKPRIIAKPMDPDTLESLMVKINEPCTTFDLNRVHKLYKNEKNLEVTKEVNVVEEMMKEQNGGYDESDLMKIL